ncbi:MAG: FtsX-like permease family protein [Calditrichaeota bacterium]|nr:FtsX-like permease family protein [Calditrichota bacterium]
MWMLLDDFFHDLKSNKTRVFLTTFAIIWGTIAIVLLMAFGRGFKTRMVTSMLNAGNMIIRVYGGQTSIKFQGLPEGRRIRFTREDADVLKQSIPQIQQVSPSYGRWGVRLKYDGKKASTYCEGVMPNFEYLRTMYPKAGGRFLDELDEKEKRRSIFLGSEIAQELFGNEDPIGKTITMDNVPFTVVGVMQKKLQLSMSNGPDDRRAIIPFSTFESIYGHRYLRMITVRAHDVSQNGFVRSEIARVLGKKLRFDPKDENAIQIWDFVQNVREMDKVFTGIEIFLGMVGALTLLVAGVGVANIMYVVVKERTREIGIKLAIGAKNRHIVSQFVFEALLIAVIGGTLGILISTGIVELIRMIPVQNQGLAYLGKPEISHAVLLTTTIILGSIGIIAGVFPARKAARMSPVESLRYE